MARLTDLPQDLLPHFFKHLSQNDHHALARVCRALSKLATPYLYREIRITAVRSQSCALKIASLLRSLLTRPHLTSHISSVRYLGPQSCWSRYDPWPKKKEHAPDVKLWGLENCTALSQAQIIFASNMLCQLVDDDAYQSQTEFFHRTNDTLAILLLTRCSELQTLELGDGFLKSSRLLPQILKRTDFLFPKLHHTILGNKTFDGGYSVSYMDLELIRPVFYSSTIQKFEWTMAEPWQFRWIKSKAPRSETLSILHLFRTNITRSTLNLLLSATPRLQTLHYEQEIPFNKSTPSAPSLSSYLDLEGLNVALSRVKDTLQECRLIMRLTPGSISTSQYAACGIPFPTIQGNVAVFQSMLQLKKAELPMIMLLGWEPNFVVPLEDVLPACITSLVLRDDFVAYSPWTFRYHCEQKIASISEYIGKYGTYTPRLESLSIRLTNGKRYLQNSMQDLRTSTKCTGSESNVRYGAKSETYTWRFDSTKTNLPRAGQRMRMDSLLPVYRDGDPRLLRSPVVSFF